MIVLQVLKTILFFLWAIIFFAGLLTGIVAICFVAIIAMALLDGPGTLKKRESDDSN